MDAVIKAKNTLQEVSTLQQQAQSPAITNCRQGNGNTTVLATVTELTEQLRQQEEITRDLPAQGKSAVVTDKKYAALQTEDAEL